MKPEATTVTVIPHGRLGSLMEGVVSDYTPCLRIAKTWKRSEQAHELWQLLVTFSDELDARFVQTFREKATPTTKLLILNDSQSSDRLLSSIVDLQIRSPRRFYVVDRPFKKPDVSQWQKVVHSLLERLCAFAGSENDARILDARLDDETLHVVSTDFRRLEVPISKAGSLAKVDKETVQHFEIDDDGAYVYWPDLDLHLGWEQLLQVVDPESVRKAQRKSRAFNERYGAAIRRIREEKGLGMDEILGLSNKQLRRIESGKCRLTSNAAKELAKAHGMTPNQYLQKVAEVLGE